MDTLAVLCLEAAEMCGVEHIWNKPALLTSELPDLPPWCWEELEN